MATLKEQIVDYLSEQGLRPQIDEDNDIYFKYQMLNYFISTDDGDENYIRVVLPGIFTADENNRSDVLEATNQVTTEMKFVKCILVGNDVHLSIEYLCDSTPEFDDFIPRQINVLGQAREEFYNALRNL